MSTPLAERMRPKNLDEFVGQKQLVAQGAVLRNVIESGQIPSFILWGPPGVGKTTLASIIANTLKRPYYALSAINSGVKDVRETIAKAESNRFFNSPNPILFIDEIHRFSKSQQDSLLGAVEKGTVTLIGATTENPSFEVISALLSRCQVYVLKPLDKEDLIRLIDRAIIEDSKLRTKSITINQYDALLQYSGGDARRLLNSLEIVANHFLEEDVVIDNKKVGEIIQANMALYDKAGEQHYDIASAFIKSIRGSDPNAAVYYLARMIEGGEDAKFICRRMLISASEDIGMANPNALLICNAVMDAVRNIGMPEGRIPMAQAAVYLASSPKSNASYMAINLAQAAVRKTGNLSIPLPLRNAPTKLMKNLNYGKNYEYAHNHANNFVNIEYMPDNLSGSIFYEPGSNGAEDKIRASLRDKWKEKYGY
ncbi:replication-associated recombination protein A [Saprospiraceae bacterium]|jgi:putative ATPase|nr:replication-associated recombination protein A [Saprospiraceae bacterium]MDA9332743.1 replication-associated recombination protein A [Saprospiraceae bacterium]MDA9358414.1 replication-associated recombination protein A [Saprospiraceae bacterium]MDA9866291.1 replication-associated recombination protein A [Saprospiraceae bacterium]MDC1305907.1 replication-associated recombination protein A [Saprospiraceae bacterium]